MSAGPGSEGYLIVCLRRIADRAPRVTNCLTPSRAGHQRISPSQRGLALSCDVDEANL